ncbi:hypothetical protein Aab01nite_13970 [Paractinoplanes abujensis]|nr:hypothetical protein Aab01nite_13970 [Actinoplanes abujensis]
MTDCTELHAAGRADGLAREGQEGMPRRPSMTDRTEPHAAAHPDGLAREGQEGMPRRLRS